MTSALALSRLLVFGFCQRMNENKADREKQDEIYQQEIEHKKKKLTQSNPPFSSKEYFYLST
ncbi:MAG: hypothetical protein ACI9SG_001117 [Maribacter sp.]|jgi:hypothetical protein